jgi:hypothetical protein
MYDGIQAGQVRHGARHAQIHDGSGLDLPRGITHTDIDAVYEFWDEHLIVFCEFKMRGKDLPCGQRTAIHSIARASSSPDPRQEPGANPRQYVSVVLVLDHDVQDTDAPVVMRECTVRSCDVYYKGREHKGYTAVGLTLRDALHEMLEMRLSALREEETLRRQLDQKPPFLIA